MNVVYKSCYIFRAEYSQNMVQGTVGQEMGESARLL